MFVIAPAGDAPLLLLPQLKGDICFLVLPGKKIGKFYSDVGLDSDETARRMARPGCEVVGELPAPLPGGLRFGGRVSQVNMALGSPWYKSSSW